MPNDEEYPDDHKLSLILQSSVGRRSLIGVALDNMMNCTSTIEDFHQALELFIQLGELDRFRQLIDQREATLREFMERVDAKEISKALMTHLLQSRTDLEEDLFSSKLSQWLERHEAEEGVSRSLVKLLRRDLLSKRHLRQWRLRSNDEDFVGEANDQQSFSRKDKPTELWLMTGQGRTCSYDVRRRRWTRHHLPACITKESQHRTVLQVDKFLYLLGGFDKRRAHRNVWKLHLKSLEWSAGPPLIVGRYRSAAAVVRGTIFLFGGTGHPENLVPKRLDKLEEQGEWQRLDDMPFSASLPIAATIGDKVYLVATGTKQFHVMHSEGMWTQLPNILFDDPRYLFGTTHTRLFIFGQLKQQAAYFDVERQEWSIFDGGIDFGRPNLALYRDSFFALAKKSNHEFDVIQFQLATQEWTDVENSLFTIKESDSFDQTIPIYMN